MKLSAKIVTSESNPWLTASLNRVIETTYNIVSALLNKNNQIQPLTFASAGNITMPITDEATTQKYFSKLKTDVISPVEGQPLAPVKDKNVVAFFSGGNATGGHDVLVGLLKGLGIDNNLYVAKGGPGGLLKQNFEKMNEYRISKLVKRGGFFGIGTDRTKFKKDEFVDIDGERLNHYEALKVIVQNKLDNGEGIDTIVVIGGDDSNTNAAQLAQYFIEEFEAGRMTKLVTVVSVPKTVDGDLRKGKLLPISFGFHSFAKAAAKLFTDLKNDAAGQAKYWFFVRVMGRSASSLMAEAALQGEPHISLISEELEGAIDNSFIFPEYNDYKEALKELFSTDIDAKKLIFKGLITEETVAKLASKSVPTKLLRMLQAEVISTSKNLDDVVTEIVSTIVYRAARNMKWGVMALPEGLIEFIPEMKALIEELNKDKLSEVSKALLATLPKDIATQLTDQDEHKNLKVSQVPTERLLIQMIPAKINDMLNNPDAYVGKGIMQLTKADIQKGALKFQVTDKKTGDKKIKFDVNPDFWGYQVRSAEPSEFDQSYSFNLGATAAALALGGHTGYMASITSIEAGGLPIGIPVASMTRIERGGPVIAKALFDVGSVAYDTLIARRPAWAEQSTNELIDTGTPFERNRHIPNQMPMTVALNNDYMIPTSDRIPQFKLGEPTTVTFKSRQLEPTE